MNTSEFDLNFLEKDLPADPEPSFFEHFFLDYTPSKWVSEVNGGLFQFFDDSDIDYSLTIQHSPDHGVCLTYMFGKGFKVKTFVTVADASKLADVIDVGVDEFVPVGAFIPPKSAWPIVEGFLKHPTSIPKSELMFDVEKTDWPDLYG